MKAKQEAELSKLRKFVRVLRETARGAERVQKGQSICLDTNECLLCESFLEKAAEDACGACPCFYSPLIDALGGKFGGGGCISFFINGYIREDKTIDVIIRRRMLPFFNKRIREILADES